MRLISKLLATAAPLTIALGFIPVAASAAPQPCDYTPAQPGPDGNYGSTDDIPAAIVCGRDGPSDDNFDPEGLTVVGYNTVWSDGAVAIGQYVVLEPDTNSSGFNLNHSFSTNLPEFPDASVGIGYRTHVDGDRNVAVGAYSQIDSEQSVMGLSVSDATAIGSTTRVSGEGGTALGSKARAMENATAAGFRSAAWGSFSSAFGVFARAGGNGGFAANGNVLPNEFTNDRTTAIGAGSMAGAGAAGQTDATAVGFNAQANAVRGLALGANSRAEADNAVAIGQASVADEALTVSVGRSGTPFSPGFTRRIVNLAAGTSDTDAVNVAQLNAALAGAGGDLCRSGANPGTLVCGEFADEGTVDPAEEEAGARTAIGWSALAQAPRSTALGYDSGALGNNSVAIGSHSRSFDRNGTAVGDQSLTAEGAGNSAFGQRSIAISGDNNTASGHLSFAGGRDPTINRGNGNTANGQDSASVGDLNSAFGQGSRAGGFVVRRGGPPDLLDGAIIGYSAFSNARTTAIGAQSSAGATGEGQSDATAIGFGAQANVGRGLAVGANSQVMAENAVALGQGSIADRAASVSVGVAGEERQIVHVAAGTEASDAVNLGQLDAVATHAASAQTRADAAFANAAIAQATADRARTEAAEAMAAANTGVGNAAEARARADEAFAEAVNAQATANTARTEAFAAQETADTARREAAAAQATGDLARTEAATAQGAADLAVAANVRQDGELGAVRAVNARQDDELIAVRTVNARQDGEIATARETADVAILRSDTLGASTAAALGGGSAYDAATGRLSAPAYGIGGRSYDNVGSAFAAVDDRLGQIDMRIDGVIDASQQVRKEARRGIAAAVSLSPAPFPSAPGRTSYTANTAVYRGEAAISASIAHRLDAAAPFAVTGGFGFSGGRDLAVRVGVAGEF